MTGLIIFLIVALGLAVAALTWCWYNHRQSKETADMLDGLLQALKTAGFDIRNHQPRNTPETATAPKAATVPQLPPDLIIGPPLVDTPEGKIAVGNWLQHYAPDTSWPEVTIITYDHLLDIPEVVDYFPDGIPARVKAHFAKVLTDVTRRGLTKQDLKDLEGAHLTVRNSRGEPITESIWDMVIKTFVEVLSSKGVPDAAIGELAQRVAPVKAVLVKA